jgi:methylmalonyl-CoA mutase C-terminal domain/subunit
MVAKHAPGRSEGTPSDSEVEARPDSGDGEQSEGRKIRVLIAKPGLDGHDRGAKVIARALRDAGMEVIYTGLHQTPEMIAEAALQEDVDAVGLSILSGAHMALFPRVMEEMRKRGLDDVLIYAGGIIPDDDIPAIKEMGIAGVFGPGTPMENTVRFVRENVKRET